MPSFIDLDTNALGQYLRTITFPDSDDMGGTYERTLRSDAVPLTREQMMRVLVPGVVIMPEKARKSLSVEEQQDRYFEHFDAEDMLEDAQHCGLISAAFEHEGFTVHVLNWLDGDAQLLFAVLDGDTMLMKLENNDAKKSYTWQKRMLDAGALATARGRCWIASDTDGKTVGVYTAKSQAERAAGDGGSITESTLNYN
jgi:hypothetical protein